MATPVFIVLEYRTLYNLHRGYYENSETLYSMRTTAHTTETPLNSLFGNRSILTNHYHQYRARLVCSSM